MSDRPPLSFVPGHSTPEDIGSDPRCFAFRRRELLVTEDGKLPGVATIDAHGIEAVRTQYLGQLGATDLV